MRTHILALTLAGSLLSCCNDNDEPMTRLQYCLQRAERECSNVAPACLMPETECMASREAVCNNQARIDLDGQRAFVPANAQVCLAKVSEIFAKLERGKVAIGAHDWRSIDEACERVFQGRAQANQTCKQSSDCTGTLVCDRGYCGTAKVVGAGAGCANTGEFCAQGSYCSGETGRPVCTGKLGYGGACSLAVPCQETLRCDATGLCVERFVAGAICQADADCETGFCEPFAQRCAIDVRFAMGTPACAAFQTASPTRGATAADAAVD